MSIHLECVLNDVGDERRRQDKLWGHQADHTPERYLAILVEEVGEVAKEIADGRGRGNAAHYRKELLHVAAVAVKAIEASLLQRR